MTREQPDERVLCWGAFEWSERKLVEIVETVEHEVFMFPIAPFVPFIGLMGIEEIPPQREVDLTVPCILAPMIGASGKDYGPFLADGWHRLLKAYEDGVERLPGYVLTVQESCDARVDTNFPAKYRRRARKNVRVVA